LTTSEAAVGDGRSSRGHGVEQVLQAGPHLLGGVASAAHRPGAVAGGTGEVEQVGVLGVVEL
jgi:hypothetical protein